MHLGDLLTLTQAKTLRAVVNRIVPEDEYPSAWTAGAAHFFRQLFLREPRYLPVYQSGLESTNAEALAAWESPFYELPPDRQDALLAQIEDGTTQTKWEQDAPLFFRLIVDQSLESFYADPGNGGNTNGISWEMIGYRVTG